MLYDDKMSLSFGGWLKFHTLFFFLTFYVKKLSCCDTRVFNHVKPVRATAGNLFWLCSDQMSEQTEAPARRLMSAAAVSWLKGAMAMKIFTFMNQF